MDRKWLILLMTTLTLLGTAFYSFAAAQGDTADASVVFGVS